MNDIQTVSRAFAPDGLSLGIMAAGSVENYYNICLEMERRGNGAFQAAAHALGLQVSTPFPPNAHEVIEQAVTQVQQTDLSIVSTFINAGLTTTLDNWWGIPSLRRRHLGKAGRAHRTMVPDSRGERFVLQEGGTSWPVFCTWSNFSFDVRELAIGQRMGSPLDVSHATRATYLDNQAIEDQAINGLTDEQGTTITIDGMSAPGLLNSTNTFSYATWTGLTGAQIVDELQDAIEALRLHHKGPYTVFLPSNYSKKITSDYGTAYPKTILMRLQELGPWGGRNLQVVITDTLPNDRVVIVAMRPDVVDVTIGQQPVPLSWKDNSGFNTYWNVLACVIFRMFPDADGNYGVVVGNLA